MLSVHLSDPPEPGCLDYLRSLLSGDISLTLGDDCPEQTEALVNGMPSRNLLESCPRLRAVIIPWAGVPEETRLLLLDFPGISAYNLHHNAAPTAELAVALLLAAAKHIVPYDQALRRHNWSPRYQPNPSVLLDGKNALVLGFGAIGQRIGRACHGLGMKVYGIRRNPSKAVALDYPAQVFSLDSLKTLLPIAHALLISLPGTPNTNGLIGKAELNAMPPGSLLVNVGRGPIVDQEALYQALKDGHLAAAGLDVWYNYPNSEEAREQTPPADYPFHELENVVFSPHRGGASAESERLRMEHLADLLNALAAGKDLPEPVNIQAGY